MLIDLQVHSNHSDGYLTPTQVAQYLFKNKVKVAALTDHNTTTGISEFHKACLKYKIKPIVGVEIYVKFNTRKLNLLWYNFDYTNPELHKIFLATQVRRRNNVITHLKKLIAKGLKIDIATIIAKYPYYTPINQVIRDILSVRSNRKIIQELLQSKAPREEEIIKYFFYSKKFVPSVMHNCYINIHRIIALKKKIGGKLIFNHPGKRHDIHFKLFSDLKKIGIDGTEILSPHHSMGKIMAAQDYAMRLNWIMTGGSDFHRIEGDEIPTQSSLNYFKINSHLLKNIEKIIG